MAFNGIELGLLPNGYYKYCSKEFVTETILLFTIFPPTITSCSFHKYISKQIRIHIIIRYTKWHRIPEYELPWIERHKTMLNEMQNCRLCESNIFGAYCCHFYFSLCKYNTHTNPTDAWCAYLYAGTSICWIQMRYAMISIISNSWICAYAVFLYISIFILIWRAYTFNHDHGYA